MNTCKTCRWFERMCPEELHGWCHRYPPKNCDDLSSSSFTVVSEDDWCGEHSAIVRKPDVRDENDIPVIELGLSVRTRNVLTRANVLWLSDITSKTAGQLREEFPIGPTSLDELRANLSKRGLALVGERSSRYLTPAAPEAPES